MSWILDRGWWDFWVFFGFFFITAIFVPVLYALDSLNQWMWKHHTPTRQWIARHLGI